MNVTLTYQLLLIVQAIHLIHHRVAKRHVSYVEGVAAIVLCLPPVLVADDQKFAIALMFVHCALMLTQILGSIFIKRFSPDHFEVSL